MNFIQKVLESQGRFSAGEWCNQAYITEWSLGNGLEEIEYGVMEITENSDDNDSVKGDDYTFWGRGSGDEGEEITLKSYVLAVILTEWLIECEIQGTGRVKGHFWISNWNLDG